MFTIVLAVLASACLIMYFVRRSSRLNADDEV